MLTSYPNFASISPFDPPFSAPEEPGEKKDKMGEGRHHEQDPDLSGHYKLIAPASGAFLRYRVPQEHGILARTVTQVCTLLSNVPNSRAA